MKKWLTNFIKTLYYVANPHLNKGVIIKSKYVSKKNLKNKSIEIGCHSYIGRGVKLFGKVKIGKYTSFSDGPSELNAEKANIKIGNYCSVGRNFFPRTSSHFINNLSTSTMLMECLDPTRESFVSCGDINIGHDVWIGANVTIIGNVNIGNGAIVGAGSVVTKDIQPYSINAGVPSKYFRSRFDSDIINMLEQSMWWESDPKELTNLKSLIFNPLNDTDSDVISELLNSNEGKYKFHEN